MSYAFEETKSEMIISLTNQNEDDSPFVSRYELDYLNEKFGKTIQFKSIEEFRKCLKVNVEKQLLIIKNHIKMLSILFGIYSLMIVKIKKLLL